LEYRGIPIEQLAEKSNFYETAYLVIFGELPNHESLETFKREIYNHSFLDTHVLRVLDALRFDAHPMSQMVTCFSALGGVYSDANPSLVKNPYKDFNVRVKQMYRILGQSAIIAANIYRKLYGLPLISNYEYNPDHS